MKISLCLMIAGLLSAIHARSADVTKTGGGHWQTLFNGKDLAGWVPMNGGTYSVTNGVLHLAQGQGWLRSTSPHTNFIFELEWRGVEPKFNSGIFVRAPMEGKPWAPDVWQVNLKQSAVGELLAGSRKAVPSTTAREVNQWVKYRIEARGSRLTLWIDGERAWEYNDFPVTGGYLGLQAEGKTIEFRNLRVQDLAEPGS